MPALTPNPLSRGGGRGEIRLPSLIAMGEGLGERAFPQGF